MRASHWGGLFPSTDSRARGLSSCCAGLVASWHVESSWTRGWTCILWIGKRILNHWRTGVCYALSHFSHVGLWATLWTVAHQPPLSMGFSSQEYWSGLHGLLQGIFLTQGSNPGLPHCSGIFTAEPLGKPKNTGVGCHPLPQGIFLTKGSKEPRSPALQADSLPVASPGKSLGSNLHPLQCKANS